LICDRVAATGDKPVSVLCDPRTSAIHHTRPTHAEAAIMKNKLLA
jgi:hypothetical protein